ncbi:MAG TPA: methyltransferase domain-containing protein [Cytophagales bacterium]|nr:methyltransferase domain-containing protein [Cytophagales bacterium]
MLKYSSLYFLVLIIFFNCSSKKEDSYNEEVPLTPIDDHDDTVSFTEFDDLIEEYEAEDRDKWQHPETILNFLGDLSGKTIADIGAGTGYFSFKLAKKADTVYAVEIDKRFLDYIEERKEGLHYGIGQNVITVLASPSDPGLFPKQMDLILLVNTYSYINNRPQYFKKVKRILKSNGFLCIVDFKEKNTPVGPPNNIKVSVEKAMAELKKAGFKDFKVDSVSLPYQYILKAS